MVLYSYAFPCDYPVTKMLDPVWLRRNRPWAYQWFRRCPPRDPQPHHVDDAPSQRAESTERTNQSASLDDLAVPVAERRQAVQTRHGFRQG